MKRKLTCFIFLLLILSCLVPVSAQTKKTKYALSKTSISLIPGEVKMVSVRGINKKKITWSVKNDDVAYFTKNGMVHARQSGTTKFTATFYKNHKKQKRTGVIRVSKKPSLSQTTACVDLGGRLPLKNIVQNYNTKKYFVEVTSDSANVSISDNGTVKGIHKGTAVINYSVYRYVVYINGGTECWDLDESSEYTLALSLTIGSESKTENFSLSNTESFCIKACRDYIQTCAIEGTKAAEQKQANGSALTQEDTLKTYPQTYIANFLGQYMVYDDTLSNGAWQYTDKTEQEIYNDLYTCITTGSKIRGVCLDWAIIQSLFCKQLGYSCSIQNSNKARHAVAVLTIDGQSYALPTVVTPFEANDHTYHLTTFADLQKEFSTTANDWEPY